GLRGAPFGCSPLAEQPLEDNPRVVLGRKRRGRRAPRQRIQVGAAVTVLALSAEEVEVDRELERWEYGLLSQLRCGDLIDRDTVPHVGALGALGVDACQPRTGATR